jgi:hypothetical protein
MHGLLRRTALAGACIVALATAPAALADGTETLGDPSVPISNGTDFAVGGVGTHAFADAPVAVEVNVPDNALVKQVLVYWEGHVTWPTFQPDSAITLNGLAVNGTKIGGPTNFFFAEDWYTFRADVSALNLVKPGANTLTVNGMNFETKFNPSGNGGVGLIVIYDDGSANKFGAIKDGSDLAFADFAPPLNATVPQTLTFEPANEDRSGKLGILAGSVSGTDLAGVRGNVINGTYDTGETFSIVNALQSNQGLEFDAASFALTVPAGATSLTVQIVSQGGVKPASLDWIAATASLEEPPPPPPGGQGCTPGYWKNHIESWQGYTPSQALSPVFSPAGLGTLASDTLLTALKYGGGSTLEAKKRILLRAAVASVLNAAHSGVAFGSTPAEIISAVNAALESNDGSAILALATDLDERNNAGCKLN